MFSSLNRNQRGVAAICACMAAYTVNDVLVKQILRTYPIGETIFVRGLMCSLVFGAIIVALGNTRQIFARMTPLLALRSLCDGLSTATFIASLAHMKLASISAVLQIAPLLIITISVLVYREGVGWRRWTAIGVGIVGALLVIKPVPSEFDMWAALGAGSALAAALREIINRQIGRTVPVLSIAFWGAVAITLFGLPLAATEHWAVFELPDLFKLLTAALFISLAIYLLALGFREADLSIVAPFRYMYLLTSAVGGFLVFQELPDTWTVLGGMLIVASGVYTLHREAIRRRNLTAQVNIAA